MIEKTVEIAAADGAVTTFIAHPERGGPHPVVMFYMDAPGIREELRDMARRLATSGYYVMLPNLYYRSGVLEMPPEAWTDPERKLMFGLMESITIPMVMSDTEGLFAYADTDPAASGGRAGCVGYCMSGQYAINAAARWPARMGAAASLHGTFLVTDKEDSPHLVAPKATGELYFGCAETDRWAPLETVEELAASLKTNGVNAEVEIYPGTQHGFVFPQRPTVYDKRAAERHWERLLALYGRTLS